MSSPVEPAAELVATIHRASVDADGAWKVVLEVPMSDGPKVAALALNTDAVFKVVFYADAEKGDMRL